MTVLNYGGPAGVQVSIVDGFIRDVLIGRPQKTVIFGEGRPSNAQAQPNTPIPIQALDSPVQLFGEGSQLASEIDKATTNGSQKTTEVNGNTVNLLYAVMPERVSVVDEQITGAPAQLQHSPIEEDIESIEVERVSDNTLMKVEWRYDDTLQQPTAADTVFVDPNDGIVSTPDGQDYRVSYHYHEWNKAMEAARNVVNPLETGVWGVLSNAETVAQDLSKWMDTLRPPYQMVRGVMGAQPNKTGDNGEPLIDAQRYQDTIANDAVWLAANARRPGGGTLLGGITGMMAGHDLTDPIFGDRIRGYPTASIQSFRDDEANTLKQKGVMVIGKSLGTGDTPVLESSNSTYEYDTGANILEPQTLNTWVRDYHRRRIVDQVILMGRAAGQYALKRPIDDDTLKLVEEQFVDDIKTFIRAGLLVGSVDEGAGNSRADDPSSVAETPGGRGENETYSVNAVRLATDTIGIAATVTPGDVAKHAEVQISLAKNPGTNWVEARQGGDKQDGSGNTQTVNSQALRGAGISPQ